MAAQSPFDHWLEAQSLSADTPGVDLARQAWEAACARYVHVQRNGEEEILSIACFTPVQRRALDAGMGYHMVVGSEYEVLTEREMIKEQISDAYASGCMMANDPSAAESTIQARADLLCERLTTRRLAFAARPSDHEWVRRAIADAVDAGILGGFFPTGQAAQALIDQLDAPTAQPSSPRP